MLIEKYDPEMNSLEKLKNEPVRFGNQKRKRLLKHYEKVQQLIDQIDLKNQISNNKHLKKLNTIQLNQIKKKSKNGDIEIEKIKFCKSQIMKFYSFL